MSVSLALSGLVNNQTRKGGKAVLYKGFVFSHLVSGSISLALSVLVNCQKAGKAGKAVLYTDFAFSILV